MDALELMGLLGLALCLVIGFSVPQLSGLSGVAVSAIVSILVTKEYGGRWTYERQALRDHAMALVGDIQSWAHSIEGHTKIGLSYTEYGPEGQSGIRRALTGFFVLEASDPELRYMKQLKEHFNTGYPDIAKSWEQLKSETTECNKAIADILNSVTPALNEIGKESGAVSFYGPPLAEQIYRESEAQMKTGYMFHLPMTSVIDKEGWSCITIERDEQVAQFVAKFQSLDQAKVAETKIDSLVKRMARSGGMKELLGQEEDYAKRRVASMEEIESVEKGIRLGKLLLGKCEDCPT